VTTETMTDTRDALHGSPPSASTPEAGAANHGGGGKPRVVFIEGASSGHRLPFVRYLLEALAATPRHGTFIFLLGPDFQGKLEEPLIAAAQSINAVEVHFFTADELRAYSDKRFWKKRAATLRIYDQRLKALGADMGFVSFLDDLMPMLALSGGSGPDAVPLSGILHRPNVHYGELKGDHPDGGAGGSGLRMRLKDIIYRRAFRHPRLRRVLALDPMFIDFVGRKYKGGDKAMHLPEPYSLDVVPQAAPSGDGRATLLMFGEISERKGCLKVLDAAAKLDPEDASRLRISIAGRIDPSVKDAVASRVTALKQSRPEIEVELHDRYIPDEELHQRIAGCDAVLATYQNHVGSSGILVWAAQFGKPVISQSSGMMGAVVRRYSLGITCDSGDPSAIADCLSRCARSGTADLADPERQAEFAKRNTRQAYAETVFDSLGAQAR
jgi:glycosyltransferase involved in cell wall biosynthesis